MARMRRSLKRQEVGELMADAAAKALGWVQGHREDFNPLAHASVPRLKFAIKAAAELALLCSIACTRRRGCGIHQAYRDLAAELWHGFFVHEPTREYLLDNPTGLPLLSLYSALYRCGYDDASYRSRLIELLRDGYVAAGERPPAGQLDFLYGLQVAGFEYRSHWAGGLELSLESGYRRSLLSSRPSVYHLTTPDVYAMTHVAFFATDFGAALPDFFSADDREYFDAAMPRLLEFYVRKGNWDLTAELLIVLRCLGVSSDREVHEGWLLMLAAQNADGGFPGPVTDEIRGYGEEQGPAAAGSGVAPGEPSVDGNWIDFRDNYHTTLAVLLAVEVEESVAGGR